MSSFPTKATNTWLAEMSSFPTNLPTSGGHQHLAEIINTLLCTQHMRTSNQLVNYKGTHNGVITSHEIVAGYEGTDNTTDQLQHIHTCTQLVIITTHGLCTQSLM